MRKGMIQCLTFKLLYFILYFNDVTIKESVRKKVTKHDICHHEMWVGVVNTMDKDNTKECLSWRWDRMGQDMSYKVQNSNIFLYRSTHFTFCLNFPISAWNIFLGLSRLSYVVSPFWDDTVYLKSNLKFISITFAANVYRLISQNLHRL